MTATTAPQDTTREQDVTRSDTYREAERLFQETLNRISHLDAARRIWNRHLRSDEREALGSDFETAVERHQTAFRMWAFVRHVSEQHAVLQVGEALGQLSPSDVDFILRETGELPRDPGEAREAAIDRGDLVLIRQPREAYWRGGFVDVDWSVHSASWEFLLIAAERAMRGQIIDRLALGTSLNSDSEVVAKRKSRLKSTRGVPESLIACFEVAGLGTQRLAIPPDQIHIFDEDV